MCCVRFVYFHCRVKGRKLNSLAREFRRHIRSAILVSVDVVNIFKWTLFSREKSCPLSNKIKRRFRYMKIHIFALRWKDEIRRSSQLRTLLKLVVVSRTWKKFSGPYGIRFNYDILWYIMIYYDIFYNKMPGAKGCKWFFDRTRLNLQALWTPQKVRIKETILYKLRNKKD